MLVSLKPNIKKTTTLGPQFNKNGMFRVEEGNKSLKGKNGVER